MSFPAYDEYKDSGAGWLGEIPSNWNVVALKYIVSLKSGDGITGESIEETGEYPVYGGNGLRGFTDDFTHDGHYVVVGRQGALCGNINYANGRFWASEHAVVASPRKSVDTIWLGEMLRAINLNQYSVSAAQPGLSMELVGNLRTVLPPLDEQKAISSFLDVETSKIDGLVSEQRRLIELLKEKRQAVISHAVTKGLDPHAPMKPSGIQWLGDVPQHWSVTRLGYFATIENGSTPSRNNLDYWDDGTIPWVSSGEVNQYHITEPSELITQAALDDCPIRLLSVGTILIGMIGQGKTRGLAAILKIEATINQNLAAIITGEKLESVYLHYIFQSAYVFLREFGRGGQQAALNCEILGATQIPVPPVDEQKAICSYLDDQLAKFDSLVTEAERAIKLLQERRTALISAAVTGKIDVREFAYQETA